MNTSHFCICYLDIKSSYSKVRYYCNMSKRVTIIISDINFKKLSMIRAKMIEEGQNASLSRVINDMLTKSLKDN